MSIYLELTGEFNESGLRAIISSGQAVVLHRLAIMSKDGDWIVREDDASLAHILDVLARHGARYRSGAPLDRRWMAGGWSAHLEFRHGDLRVRTDFVTRPPRVTAADLEALWREQEGRNPPFVDARRLVEIKKTNREKDFVVIGELARIMPDVRDRIMCSRSARDLIEMAGEHRELVEALVGDRPVLARVREGREALETALDAERRSLIRANERRLGAYIGATARGGTSGRRSALRSRACRWPTPTDISSSRRKRSSRPPSSAPAMDEMRDEFLSEEDLDLRNLSWEELLAVWQAWLEQAQATNDLDEHVYSHGVFADELPER